MSHFCRQLEGTEPGGGWRAIRRARPASERLNPLVQRREPARLWRGGHAGADRIEVDISQAGRQGRLIENGLAFVSSLPEAARAVVFPVGAAGNRFRQSADEARQTRQPGANLLEAFGI